MQTASAKPSPFHDRSVLSRSAGARVLGVLAVLTLLWLAVAWAVAVP